MNRIVWESGDSLAESEDPMAGPPVDGGDPDGLDDDPIVSEAVAAVRRFSGGDVKRATARQLLPMWRSWDDLSPETMVAVIRRFPSPTDGKRNSDRRGI